MRKPKPTKIVGYLRTSTDDQLLGMDVQKERLDQVAKDRQCPIVRTFLEHESGGDRSRPELDKAIRHARRINAFLVVAKLDRLARDQEFLMGLVNKGLPIIFGDMPDVDFTSTAAGRLNVQILAAFAEFELRCISDRTRSALAILKKNGVKLGKPENLTQDGRERGAKQSAKKSREQAIDDQADIASIAVQMRSQGASLARIAAHLNSEGYPTRHGSEGNGAMGKGGWRPVQVKRILDRLKPSPG
jgi:DNA invertase Pin-like site-specific DNA recombinase